MPSSRVALPSWWHHGSALCCQAQISCPRVKMSHQHTHVMWWSSGPLGHLNPQVRSAGAVVHLPRCSCLQCFVSAKVCNYWAACCGQGLCGSHVLGSTWMIHGAWVIPARAARFDLHGVRQQVVHLAGGSVQGPATRPSSLGMQGISALVCPPHQGCTTELHSQKLSALTLFLLDVHLTYLQPELDETGCQSLVCMQLWGQTTQTVSANSCWR